MRFHKFSLKFGTVICILIILAHFGPKHPTGIEHPDLLLRYITQIRCDDEISDQIKHINLGYRFNTVQAWGKFWVDLGKLALWVLKIL